MLRTVAGRPGWRRLLVSYFPRGELACQASSVAGVTGKTPAQRRPRDEPGERGEPGPVTWPVPHLDGVPAQHRVLMPECQQPSVPGMVPAEHQDSQAK
jgi:hypothetical protein